MDVVAVLLEAGLALETFGEHRIHDGAPVEAIHHAAFGIIQRHVAHAGEGRAAEQLVRSDFSLVAGGLDGRVADDLVDRMVALERFFEDDFIDEREDGLVAGMVELRRRREADARAVAAERHIGGVGVLQGLGERQAGAGLFQGHGAAARALGGGGAHLLDLHVFHAVSLAVDVQADDIADADVLDGGNLDVAVAGLGVIGEPGLGAGLSDLGDGHDLVFLEIRDGSGILRPVADGHLGAHLETGRIVHGNAGGTLRDGDHRAVRERLPQGGRGAQGVHHTAVLAHVVATFLHGFRLMLDDGGHLVLLGGGAGADGDFVTGPDAGHVADVQGLFSLGGVHGQAGGGEAQQIEVLRSELGASGNLDGGEVRKGGPMLDDLPAGDIHFLVRSVVQFNEGVGHVHAVGDTELVDLHRGHIAHLLHGGFGPGLAVRSGPGGFRREVAVVFAGTGGDGEVGDDRLAGEDIVADLLGGLLAAEDRDLPALGRVDGEDKVVDGGLGGVHESDGGVAHRTRGEGLETVRGGGLVGSADGEALDVIAGGDDIGLDGLVRLEGRERVRRGHRALVEGSGGVIVVVSAVAQDDGTLLAHGIIAVALVLDARSVEHGDELAALGVAAHGAPVVRFAIGGCRHEAPADAGQALAILVVRIGVHASHEVVLLVGHDPRTRSVTVVPQRLVAVVGGLHGAVAVVAAVGLGVAIVEAAAGIVVVSVDDPVLAFGLVVDSRAVRVVLPQAHARHEEETIDFMPHQGDGGHVRDGHRVESAERGPDKGAAGSLIQVVALAGLVIKDGDPAGGVLAEFVLRGGVGIAARIAGGSGDDADVQRSPVGLAHHLVQGAFIGGIQGAGGTVGGHAGSAAGGIDVTGTFRTRGDRGRALGKGDARHDGGRRGQGQGEDPEKECFVLHMELFRVDFGFRPQDSDSSPARGVKILPNRCIFTLLRRIVLLCLPKKDYLATG